MNNEQLTIGVVACNPCPDLHCHLCHLDFPHGHLLRLDISGAK